MHHQVTGAANEHQVCEALRRYRDRECFVREALVHLYDLIADTDEPKPDVLKVLRFIPATCLPFLPSHLLRRSTEVTIMLISLMKRWLETNWQFRILCIRKLGRKLVRKL